MRVAKYRGNLCAATAGAEHMRHIGKSFSLEAFAGEGGARVVSWNLISRGHCLSSCKALSNPNVQSYVAGESQCAQVTVPTI